MANKKNEGRIMSLPDLLCNQDGQYKNNFKGDTNVCYESLSMNMIDRDFKMDLCPYMKGSFQQKIDGDYVFYSKCTYKKGEKK